ncbi:MAG: cytochrome c3 family protein [bacterium]
MRSNAVRQARLAGDRPRPRALPAGTSSVPGVDSWAPARTSASPSLRRRAAALACFAIALVVGIAGAAPAARAQGLSELVSPGPLSQPHHELDRLDKCGACHAMGKGVPDERCLACHEALAKRIEAKRGLHARVEGRCIDCHHDHKGSAFDMVQLDVRRFDHTRTGWNLEGRHQKTPCARCHTAKVARELGIRGETYLGLETACTSCHEDVHRGQFVDASGKSPACTSCHSLDGWKPARIDHDRTRFPLADKHAGVACAKCHANGRFKDTPLECASCHKDPHKGQFRDTRGEAQACSACHNAASWKSTRVDHDRTRFPLTGKHVAVTCAKCHANGRFEGTPLDCASCHVDPHKGQFRTASGALEGCANCHDATSWTREKIDHARTRFPLTGGHADVACAKCHAQGRFKDTPLACASCHSDPHQGQFKDARGAPQACSSCHDDLSWKTTRIDHATTRFPLAGKHAEVACAKCHAEGRFAGAPLDCASCHEDRHQGQFREVNGALTPCSACHGDSGWKPARIDHAKSRFPLTGKHVDVTCAKCHGDGRFRPLATACVSCHKDPHQGGQGNDCTTCHSTSSWKSLTQGAHTERFPLTGVHAATPCASCHVKAAQFVEHDPAWGDPESCVGCHADPHRGQFDATCAECHSTSAWQPIRFRHENTAFPLVGAHRAVDCASCHASRDYRDTPTACVACHERDFAGAARFDHRATASIDCQDCHGETAWLPARVRHDSFPLSGGHAAPTCEDCHKTKPFGPIDASCVSCHLADFTRAPRHVALGLPPSLCDQCHRITTFARHEASLPIDCFTCHRNDYLGTRDPNHVAEGISTDCAECHSTVTWDDARGDRRARVRNRSGHGGKH